VEDAQSRLSGKRAARLSTLLGDPTVTDVSTPSVVAANWWAWWPHLFVALAFVFAFVVALGGLRALGRLVAQNRERRESAAP
jgi:undecaprenyl pyrophosphate phosphatase UppP